MNYQAELAFAKDLAKQAGQIMRKYYRTDAANAQIKNDKTIVTLADTQINSLVIQKISERFPTHAVHGEEESLVRENAQFTWVCDPVDGTMPFAKGLPVSTFSLALVDNQGHAVLGVVYDPNGDRLYEAVQGNGAFCNGVKISVSEHKDLSGAYINEEIWVNEIEGISFDDPKDILNKRGSKVTTVCSAIMMGCLVAEGTFDAMLFGQSKPEDIAALSVIVTEAGGMVTNFKGDDQRYDQKIYGAVVSNGLFHTELVEILSSINYVSKNVEL